MQLLVPFTVFVLCVVVLFLVAGRIAFQDGNVLGGRSLIDISFKESDSLLKRIVVWSLVVTGSIVLLMTYLYILSLLVEVRLVFKSLMALVSGMLVYTFAGCLTQKIWYRYALALVITLAWFIWPNWVTLDVAAVCMTLVFLVNLKDVTFKSAAIVSLIVIVYDFASVFGTRVMQKVASEVLGSIPMLFTIPKYLTWESERAFAIGLGDVVLPGIVVMIAMREAKNCAKAKIGWFTIFGYVVGCVLTFTAMVVSKAPQPATIYLIPCTFFFLWLSVAGTPTWDKFLGEFITRQMVHSEQPG